jgi:hypothetical protein
MGKRFADELTDIPAQMARYSPRGHVYNSTQSTRFFACLGCGRSDERIPTCGLCSRCNPLVETWRRYRVDLQGQPPFYSISTQTAGL